MSGNLGLLSPERDHALGDLFPSVLLQVVTRVAHYVKSSVGDHVGDALSFSRVEGDVSVGEHDQHWNVPGPENRVDLRDVCGVGMPIVAGNHLGESGDPRARGRRGMGHFVLLHHPGFQGPPERPAAPEGHFPEQVQISDRKLDKPPFRNTKVKGSGTGVVLTRVFKITNDLTLS